jgi:hypothetical protein
VPSDSRTPVHTYAAGTSYPSAWQDRSRSWTNTAGYSTANRRDLPINDYTDLQNRRDQQVGLYVNYNPSGGIDNQHYVGLTDTGIDNELGTLKAEVLNVMRSQSDILNELQLKCCVKVADAKTNVAVALAEASKTSDLILGKANQLLRAYRAFRRGRLKDAASILNITPKKVHRTWLEYKYGWMPLLLDIKGAAEFFAQQSMGRKPAFKVTSTYRDSQVLNTNVTVKYGYTGVQKGTKTRLMNREFRVTLWCELENSHFSALQQIGLTNPLLYAWEVTPFSFAFDWACSVGDWLQGLTAFHGVNLQRAMWSGSSDFSGLAVTDDLGNVDPSGWRDGPFTLTRQYKSRGYSRHPLTVDPLSLYPPVQNPISSFNRLVTGLALVRSQARRP